MNIQYRHYTINMTFWIQSTHVLVEIQSLDKNICQTFISQFEKTNFDHIKAMLEWGSGDRNNPHYFSHPLCQDSNDQ